MQEAPDFVLFLGRFHPLVVHLPIGFLLFAFLLELTGRFGKAGNFSPAIRLALFSGAISALVASILGYMLSQSGDYDGQMLDNHFWFGVFTTAIAFFAWLIASNKIKISVLQKAKPHMALMTLIVVLLGVTGHYGGNLTHGSDYLTKYAPFKSNEKEQLPQLATVEEAQVYAYLVDPILQNKCVSCHNPSKKKGGLAMHDSVVLAKGGKGGPVFLAGNALGSEMIKRVTLAETHEDFMPPEGKTPLTEAEIAILHYWIEKAKGDFKITLGNVETDDAIKTLASTQLGLAPAELGSTTAMPKVAAVDAALLNELVAQGFKIRELVNGSNLFDVALPAKTVTEVNPNELPSKLAQLMPIKDHILRLDLGDNQVTDVHLASVAEFHRLESLQLEHNPIGDNGIAHLKDLKLLQHINLYGTQISNKSLAVLSSMKSLKKAYVWQTKVTPKEVAAFEAQGGQIEVVSGL